MPKGEAADVLLGGVLKAAGPGPCIGMILTDMKQTRGIPGASKEPSFDAMRALSIVIGSLKIRVLLLQRILITTMVRVRCSPLNGGCGPRPQVIR